MAGEKLLKLPSYLTGPILDGPEDGHAAGQGQANERGCLCDYMFKKKTKTKSQCFFQSEKRSRR